MPRPLRRLLVAAILFPPLCAQGAPEPAPELKRLEPLLGNWAGSGGADFGEALQWKARSSYRWVHDGHFLQEDTEIVFDGGMAPMVFRSYLGWDRDLGRYVNVVVHNGGLAKVHEFQLLADGTMLQTMLQSQQGQPYAERVRTTVRGESMALTIDLLLAEGASRTALEGTLTRSDQEYEVDWQCKAFDGAMPAPELQQLQRSAGVYEVRGAMVMAPGMPEVAITGTDTFQRVFGDTILHGVTVGTAEGMPGEYRGDVFWSFDAARKCLHGVYVSNFGEMMAMDAHWVADQLVSVSAGKVQGQVLAQRMVLSFGPDGKATAAENHTLAATGDAFRSFHATYKAK
ncbi:MAG: DUF1579 family protein [Planctomycetes bacterium]|nr:DUF1579 family protein [Planctomycetota bacterium]